MITFNDFKEMELGIATIKEVEDHPDADKLYVLKVSLGDNERQLVAGIKPYYDKDNRKFYPWNQKDLEKIFKERGLAVIDLSRQVSKVREKDIWLGYTLHKPED